MTSKQIQKVLKEVQRLLDESGNASLKVPADGFVEDDDWLNVIVTPAPGTKIKAYQYVNVLGDVEAKLQAAGHCKVLLVPALAD